MPLPLALAATLLLPQTAVRAPEPEPSPLPPSSVLVRGGETTIGSSAAEILDLLRRAPQHQGKVRAFDAETPRHRRHVDDFHLMVTEVTNEQYLAFVEATGFPPPLLWADPAALAAARVEHERAQDAEVARAREERRKPPERAPLDEPRWWERSWRECAWRMPEELCLAPVVYVDHAEARAYARWAGMRLPSEFEFQRAARGRTGAPYPWGEWDESPDGAAREPLAARAALAEVGGINAPLPVGSFPRGATSDGVLDLIGNVWEWTSSPYAPFEGFLENEYRVGRGRGEVLRAAATWDESLRVAVGGSFEMDHHVARASVRRGTERGEKTLALGFRCAASARPGLDRATRLVERELAHCSDFARALGYAPARALGTETWSSSRSLAPLPPDGYRVVRGHRSIVLVPVAALSESQPEALERASRASPLAIGLLATTERVHEPPLAPGIYLVAYRSAGSPPPERLGGEPATARARALEAKLDLARASLVFLDARTDALAAAVPIEACALDDASDAGKLVVAGEGRLRFEVHVRTPLRGRALRVPIQLAVAPETASDAWRR